LGAYQVAFGGEAVPDTVWRQRRAAAVVKLLALEPAHRLHRDQVIDALWPDLDPAAGANNLRVALYHARRGLQEAGAAPDVFLVRDGEIIVLGPPELIAVDIDEFQEALERAWRSPDPTAAQEALARYGGDLLPDDLYDDWAESRRATLRASVLVLLRRLAQLFEERGELDQTISAVQRLLATEPLDEAAHAALIRLFAMTGRRSEASAQYDRLVALLTRELAVAPQPATQDLIAAIREGRFPETASPLEPGTVGDALAAPTAAPRGLPAPVDDLIGREREVAELRQLLAAMRLVTLTGPGGVGKTRLALAAAHVASESFPAGAHFVDLAPIDDAALVLPTMAQALGVREAAGQTLFAALRDHIGQSRMLLVVDNMEHVATASPVITDLLAACPHLAALITSRSRLRLRGEQEYPVQPLAVPDAPISPSGWGSDMLLGAMAESSPAVALFTRRALAARPDFAPAGSNAAAIADIVRRLDGLPLAIELAAARVRLMTPSELLAQLDRPLGVLTGGPRDAPARQRTLRATIAWSHDLLTEDEQDLFAQLSVFAGGFTLEAVAAVAGEGDGVTGWQGDRVTASLSPRHLVTASPLTLDLVAALVDQSLVRQEERADGMSRLRMLETIREYARERLEFNGEGGAVRQRHADLFRSLAEAAAPELSGPEQALWLDRLEREHDNLRQALRYFHESEDASGELALAAALWRFWWQRGELSEGRFWLEQAIAGNDDAEKAMLADAHDGAGALAEAQGDLPAAAVHHEAALSIRREIGDRRGEARALTDFGIIADKMGDPQRATRLFADALALARAEDDRPRMAACLANLGFVALDQSDHQRAAAAFQESLALFRELEDPRNLSYVLGGLGNLAFLAGDFDGAVAVQEESLRALRELGDRQGIADTLADLGHAVQRQGHLDRAEELHVEALHRYRELGDQSGVAFALIHLGRLSRLRGDGARAEALLQESAQLSWQLGEKPFLTEAIEGLAEVACERGEAVWCARLLGAADALRETTGIPLPAVLEPDIARCVATARAALGEAGFAAARGEGRALAPEQVVPALAATGVG
jgi:predicted ATPase/DNA-binding SARP family transcriptional activator